MHADGGGEQEVALAHDGQGEIAAVGGGRERAEEKEGPAQPEFGHQAAAEENAQGHGAEADGLGEGGDLGARKVERDEEGDAHVRGDVVAELVEHDEAEDDEGARP